MSNVPGPAIAEGGLAIQASLLACSEYNPIFSRSLSFVLSFVGPERTSPLSLSFSEGLQTQRPGAQHAPRLAVRSANYDPKFHPAFFLYLSLSPASTPALTLSLSLGLGADPRLGAPRSAQLWNCTRPLALVGPYERCPPAIFSPQF